MDERLREDHVPVISIAVIGPGAIGSTVAALVHSAGHQVIVCGRTPRESIEVRPDDADPIVVPGPMRTDPDAVDGPAAVWCLAVRDTKTEEPAA